MRRLFKPQNRIALGVKIALLFMAHGKGAAIASKIDTLPGTPGAVTTREEGTVNQIAALRDRIEDTLDQFSAQSLLHGFVRHVNATAVPVMAPMNQEALRVFLQSYNAGPYAVLRYKGNVPYRETQNYVPRVLKYYQQDLSDSPYDSYIVSTSIKYGFDPQLIRAIVKTESDFNSKCVSHAGARGLMQVMPVVWKEVKKRYGFQWDYSSDVFDPEKNIEVSCAYLAWLRFDFLPKHFAAFDVTAPAPPALIRDGRLSASAQKIVVAAGSLNSVDASTPVRVVASKAVQAVRRSPGTIRISLSKSSHAGKAKANSSRKKAAVAKDSDKPVKSRKAEVVATTPKNESSKSSKEVASSKARRSKNSRS